MQNKIKQQKLIFLSIFLLILFSYPFISIANKNSLVFGVPALVIYIFTLWLIAIVAAYILVEKKYKSNNE